MLHSLDSALCLARPLIHSSVAVALAVSLSGCLVNEEQPRLGSLTAYSLTENSLTENSLTENSLTENSLTENSLTENSLTENSLTENSLEINSAVLGDTVSTESGRLFLSYVVRCALDAGDVVTATVDGVTYQFDGLLGLAPEWKTGAISTAKRQVISACLMTHVNHYGVSVLLSIRGANLPVSADEMQRYWQYEGTFYGDLFAATPVMYACSGDAAPDFTVAYPDHDPTAGDRLLRRCTDPGDPGATTTLCGFTYVGRCSDVCDTSVDGSYEGCFSGPGQTGQRYADTMSAWLLSSGDADAVWTEHYDAIYGP